MPNGNISALSLARGFYRLTLPIPCTPDKYMIIESFPNLRYTVIDMTLNNGMGDVPVGQKEVSIPGTDSLMIGIAATRHANNRDYWIMTRKMLSNRWEARLLTPNGIDSVPVVTNLGFPQLIPNVMESGQFKFNHSGTQMAFANNPDNCWVAHHPNPSFNCGATHQFELYDFDRSTGQLSNYLPLDMDSTFYVGQNPPWPGNILLTTVEFSPNDHVLWCGTTRGIIQYNLSSGNPVVIPGAWNLFSRAQNALYFTGHLQTGMDNKIYFTSGSAWPYLGVINNPNTFGTGANINAQGVPLHRQGGGSYRGLPNMVSDALITRNGKTTPHQNCEGDSFQITLTDTNFLDSVLFQFPGQPAAMVKTNHLPHTTMFPQHGTYPYYAVAYSGCEEDTIFDTLRVHPQLNAYLGPDTLLCEGDTFIMNFQDTTFSYLWNTGDTTPGIEIFLPDTYSVTVTSNYCGADTDEVVIDSIIPAIVRLPDDTLLCLGDSLVLDAEVALGTYQWSTNDTTPQYTVTQEGTYSVTSTNLCRSDSDTITVLYARPPNANLGNDTLLCTGNPFTLDATDTLSTYEWNNSSTDSTITVDSSGVYRVTVTNLCGTSIAGIQLRFADSVTLNLGPDTVLCPQDAYELDASVPFGDSYTWHTGATGSTFHVVQEDTYSVTVEHVCGTLQDTVKLSKNPTLFSTI